MRHSHYFILAALAIFAVAANAGDRTIPRANW